jgi:hypothetical protein
MLNIIHDDIHRNTGRHSRESGPCTQCGAGRESRMILDFPVSSTGQAYQACNGRQQKIYVVVYRNECEILPSIIDRDYAAPVWDKA